MLASDSLLKVIANDGFPGQGSSSGEAAALNRANDGLDPVVDNGSRPLTTSDSASRYHVLQILYPPDSDESDSSELTS